ncbi:hypothetical protein GN956_G14052 [Arapaima gigas]
MPNAHPLYSNLFPFKFCCYIHNQVSIITTFSFKCNARGIFLENPRGVFGNQSDQNVRNIQETNPMQTAFQLPRWLPYLQTKPTLQILE